MGPFNDERAEKFSDRRWQQTDPRTVGAQSLSRMLDRDKGDDMSKYRSSIASILGDSVATSICDGESVANASILGDLSVATPFTYASRKSARVDTTSPEETLDRPSSPPPVHRNHRGSVAIITIASSRSTAVTSRELGVGGGPRRLQRRS